MYQEDNIRSGGIRSKLQVQIVSHIIEDCLYVHSKVGLSGCVKSTLESIASQYITDSFEVFL